MQTRPWPGLLIVILLASLAPPPARAICSFSYPVGMSGALGGQPGFLILPDADASLGGFLWDLGHGNPADGFGNDGNSLRFFLPNGTDPLWIERDTGVALGHPEPTATIFWNWTYAGIDGCPGAEQGVTVVYVLDDSPSGPHYAVIAVAPTFFASFWLFDYDNINNGQVSPLTGVPNDVPLKRLSVGPELSNVVIIDGSTMQADVASPTDTVNYYDDQGSAGPYPGLIINEVQRLVARDTGGGNETEIPGCADGCQAVLLPTDKELCWDGQVRFGSSGQCEVASDGQPLACETDGDCGYCELLPGKSCIPGPGGDAVCASGGGFGDCLQDTCNPGPLTFGPPVAGNCAEQGCLDTGPPTLEVTLSPDLLWPPNHRMVSIQADVTSEDECGAPMVELIEVSSDEPDDGQGDGATVNDIQDVELGSLDVEFSLRAERSGAGDGRVYTVVYRAVDDAGNQTTATSFVTVPRTGPTAEEPVLLDVMENPAGTALDWDDVSAAASYRVVRGDLANIADVSGRYELGPLSCIASSLGHSSTLGLEDPELPAQGATFFYVVEYVDVVRSSFGTVTAARERWDSPGACP